ncbi:MAG: efflux RND transporter periplasmic adaptor subunit [Bryobacteraceae bacterium]
MRKSIRFPLHAGLCFLLCLLAACSQRQQGAAAASLPEPAKPVAITCLGRIVPGQRILVVSAPPQSIVQELLVQRGSTVQRGDTIARLRDHDEAQAALREAEGEAAVAQSIVEQTKAGERPAALAAQDAAIARQEIILADAEKELNRKNKLAANGDIPSTEIDRARLAVDTAREALRRERQLRESLVQVRDVDVAAAEKRLALAAARKERAQKRLDQQIITAPASGTVLEVNAYPGEAVSAKGILDLGDTSNMFVDAEVYMSDIPRVRLGAPATVSGEALRAPISGQVAEILREAGDSTLFPPSALTAADKRVLRVRIRLADSRAVQQLSNSQVSVRIEP